MVSTHTCYTFGAGEPELCGWPASPQVWRGRGGGTSGRPGHLVEEWAEERQVVRIPQWGAEWMRMGLEGSLVEGVVEGW